MNVKCESRLKKLKRFKSGSVEWESGRMEENKIIYTFIGLFFT